MIVPAIGNGLRANDCLQGEEDDQGMESGVTQRICIYCLQCP